MNSEEVGASLDMARLVEKLEAALDRLNAQPVQQAPAFPASDLRRDDLIRRPRAPMPDPRLIRRIMRQRRLRDRYFGGDLFADPAWDMLLELTASRAENRRVTVMVLCNAAAVPQTTALRWITQMTEMRLLEREADPDDKRRAYITLSNSAATAVARYFDELGKHSATMI